MSRGAGTAGRDLPRAASLPGTFPTQLSFGSRSFQEISGIEKKKKKKPLNRTKGRGGEVSDSCWDAAGPGCAEGWGGRGCAQEGSRNGSSSGGWKCPSTVSLMVSVESWNGWSGKGH